MDMLYVLVPMSLVLVAVIAGALWWALHAGQYDDLDRPGEAILLDNDKP
jgi:cbb3-type cytochrome oxidase maturation protein